MKFFKNITTRQKHWIFFGFTAIGSILVVNLFILILYNDLSPEEQIFGKQIFWKVVTYGTIAMGIVFFVSSQFILYIFNNYIAPVEILTEETRLISVANDKYRIKPVGALETHKLTRVINDLADSYIELKSEVRNIVALSQKGFDSEKRRLETLMKQVNYGVIVCNFDGRIMTYNQKALDIMEKDIEGVDKNDIANFLGAGRSLFGVLKRKSIVQALNYIQNTIDNNNEFPIFKFVTTRFSKQFLKISIAPVLSSHEEFSSIEGFILTINDITEEIKNNSRKDIFLQSLTINLQTELESIKLNTRELKKFETESSESKLSSIESSINKLFCQINDVAIQHADRLKAPSEQEFILAEEFISIIKEDIFSQFSLTVKIKTDLKLWLTVESYTIIRGVMYLIGQLVNNIKFDTIDLAIIKEEGDAFLEVSWNGEEVELSKIEEWKQCPLLTRAKKLKTYSFESMILVTENKSPELVTVKKVRFLLHYQNVETYKLISDTKESRPLYNDIHLYDNISEHNNFDDIPLRDLTYVVFDTETTGLLPSEGDEIISIAGVRIHENKIQNRERFDQLVNPKRNIPMTSLKIHEISPDMLKDMPTIDDVLPRFYKFCENSVLVAHNAAFDMKFLKIKEEQTGVRFNNPVLDTLLLSHVCHPSQELHNLEDIAKKCGVDIIGRHTALGDSFVTAEILLKLIPILEAQGINTLKQAKERCSKTKYANLKF